MSALWTLIDLIIAIAPIVLALFLLLAYWRWRDAEDDPAPDDRHHVEVRGLCTCEKGLCGAAETFSGHAGGDGPEGVEEAPEAV